MLAPPISSALQHTSRKLTVSAALAVVIAHARLVLALVRRIVRRVSALRARTMAVHGSASAASPAAATPAAATAAT